MRKNHTKGLSEFVRFLVEQPEESGRRIPSLAELGQMLGVSVASLREQFEVARSLGFVEAKPKVGIHRLPYSFAPAVKQSLVYGVSIRPELFQQYSSLRNHIEATYFLDAAVLLHDDDIQKLLELVNQAKAKLHGEPIQVPEEEHREFHLLVYSRLGNLFVNGLLEAYWDLYEITGLDSVTDLSYLEKVWGYHQKIADLISIGNIREAQGILLEHMDLVLQRPKQISRQGFE